MIKFAFILVVHDMLLHKYYKLNLEFSRGNPVASKRQIWNLSMLSHSKSRAFITVLSCLTGNKERNASIFR
jgi:hypothetical protein